MVVRQHEIYSEIDQDISRVHKVNELDILFNMVLFHTKHFV